jgi:hypothetical protein
LGVQPVPKKQADKTARATANSEQDNKRFMGISRPAQRLPKGHQSGKQIPQMPDERRWEE